MVDNKTDAPDVLQSALISAFQAHARYDREASYKAWVYRFATHAALNHNRSCRAEPRSLAADADFSDATPVYTDVSTNLITSASGTYDPTAAANHLGTKSIVVGTRVAGTHDIIGAITTWTSTTLNSNGVVIYDDTHTSDHLFACVYFDGQVQSTSGDYAITLDANGFIQIDLVP